MKQFLLCIYLCMSIHVLLHAQDFAQGDEPWPMPEKRIEQPSIEPSRPGHAELTMAYRRDAEEQAYARAQAQEQESARYRDMPTREEAASEGETYWDRQENLRKEQARRLARERSTRAQKLSQEYYAQTMPKVREEMRTQELQQEQAARIAKEKAYTEYYANLSAQQRAQEEAHYEQQLQAFEQRANQEYQEAVRIIEQQKRAAQALSNILRSAQIEEQQNELLVKAAERAAQTAAFLEDVMQMSMREAEMRERSAKRVSRIEETKRIEQHWERAYQAAQEAEVALERIIKSADYEARFNDAIRRDIERTERQLEAARLFIKKKEEAAALQADFEEASAKFNEDWQRAQEEINKSYAKKASKKLEEIKDTIQDVKKDIIDPALRQAADSIANAVSRVSQAVSQNREWKKEAQQVAAKAQAWMNQARAWVSAQVGVMPSLAPGVVGPEAGRDISIKLREQEEFEWTTKQIASEWAKKYRQAVKDFDKRKKLKATPEYENFLRNLIYTFGVIKSAIQSNPDLKRAVTTSVVPLLVRLWRGENVLMDYIDDYLEKLDAELAIVIYSQTPKFAGLIGSGG